MELIARLLVSCENRLGEGVQWDPRSQRVYWTDIFSNALWSCDETGQNPHRVDLEAGLCAFAFLADGTLVAAFEDGLGRLDPLTGRRQLLHLYQPEFGTRTRMNDGGLDRQGRFIVGGIDEGGMHPITSVWQVSGDLAAARIDILIDGVGCANSICFSPDGRGMFFADTAKRHIYRLDYDPDDGAATNRRVFATLAADEGFPDGSCVDAQGALWNAQFGGGGVQRFLPDGSREARINLPCPNVTCCAIGGQDMRRMFITTARLGLDDQGLREHPLSGGVFFCDLPVPGLAPGLYVEKPARPGERT